MLETQVQELDGLENAAAIAVIADRAAKATHEITEHKVGPVTLLSIPTGRNLEDFTKYLANPTRAQGQQPVNDAESFLKLVARFKEAPRLVQLSLSKLNVTCICNYHTEKDAGWQDHTIGWQLKKHRDLLAWEKACSQPMSQVAFMMFLEDRLVDITSDHGGPSQSLVESIISDLEVTTDSKFHARRDLQNDNYLLHSDSTGKPTVEVPRQFDIGVPIFEGLDIAYRIPIRLRYSVKEGVLTFNIGFVNIDAVMDEAWEAVTNSIIDGLGDVPYINVP